MKDNKEAFFIAEKAHRVQKLIDNIISRYGYYEPEKKNYFLDKIIIKYQEVRGVLFFQDGNPTGNFVRFLYAYRLSGGLKNVKTFENVLYR